MPATTNRQVIAAVTASVLILLVAFFLWPRKPHAGMLITAAKVYTGLDSLPSAEAVAIDGDRIIAVGSKEDLEARFEADTVVDLHDFTVYPGFVDSHCHVEGLGALLAHLDLSGTKSIQEIRARLREPLAATSTGRWLRGRGWDQNDWPSASYPHRRDIDDLSWDVPVILTRVDGHAVWVNSAALRIAGIDKNTPDPDGGRILRERDGSPTGVFVDNAIDLITAHVPPPAREERVAAIQEALAMCVQLGLTEVHDMGVDSVGVEIYRQLLERGQLPIRLYAAVESGHTWKAFQKVAPFQSENGMLAVRALKLYVDGALGSRGAALIEPYSDSPGERGLTLASSVQLEEEIRSAGRSGYQVCIHAIGDRGNTIVLDVFDKIRKSNEFNMKAARFRVEHAQVLQVSDIPRFKETGVIPSMQPTHCTSDMYWAEKRLGPGRTRGAYAWHSLLAAGNIIPAGSDFPVESPDPLPGFYAAVTRQDRSGWPEGGWFPEERMTRLEALKAFTAWGAYAAFQEDLKGTIEPGKWADLVVLSSDIMKVPAREILECRVEMTLVGGKIVYWRRHGSVP